MAAEQAPVFFFCPERLTTEHVDFKKELGDNVKSDDAKKVLNELTKSRIALLEAIKQAGIVTDFTRVTAELQNYTSLLRGVLEDCAEGTSKLRFSFSFTWSMVLGDAKQISQKDAQFELVCIHIAVTQTVLDLCSKLNDRTVTEDECKAMYSAYKEAAAILHHTFEVEFGKLQLKPPQLVNVLEALLHQLEADGQSLAVLRALLVRNDKERCHKPELVCAISQDTASKYTKAIQALATSKGRAAKWHAYLQAKELMYTAYAHAYNAASLLATDKCGEGVSAGEHAVKLLEAIHKECKTFDGAGPKGVRLVGHGCVEDVQKDVAERLATCKRENDFIYFHKVPAEVPPLPSGRSVFSTTPYPMPPLSPLWTDAVYA
eukprot:Colp12_sorted_trinity150504_noHs@22911